jgi:hypothetical protein
MDLDSKLVEPEGTDGAFLLTLESDDTFRVRVIKYVFAGQAKRAQILPEQSHTYIRHRYLHMKKLADNGLSSTLAGSLMGLNRSTQAHPDTRSPVYPMIIIRRELSGCNPMNG